MKWIEEFEFLLDQKSIYQRVKEVKKYREADDITIVSYDPKYKSAFKKLNEECITTFFKMEEADYKALDTPKKYILDSGGGILIALYNNEPVGVYALIKMNSCIYDYELAKIAVFLKTKGKGIGWILSTSILKKTKVLGAQKIYLESNTILKPAINLYHKLGFKKVVGSTTPYERCNIQMELELEL
ncbi:GNAT family N-acetyltransferase [Aquimarina longa]|uniref:GNAT family N-acetyltransferase n=1 Tax=Aquimarina longa TaxID=1080221 RepID=UPI0007860B5F